MALGGLRVHLCNHHGIRAWHCPLHHPEAAGAALRSPTLPAAIPRESQPARHHQGAFRECHTAGIQLCGASETGLPSWQDAFEGRQAAESPRSVLVTHLALYSLLQKPARIINKNNSNNNKIKLTFAKHREWPAPASSPEPHPSPVMWCRGASPSR